MNIFLKVIFLFQFHKSKETTFTVDPCATYEENIHVKNQKFKKKIFFFRISSWFEHDFK